jgi:NADH:ubiquinone oxidoreductase subunit 6 (subunit J)
MTPLVELPPASFGLGHWLAAAFALMLSLSCWLPSGKAPTRLRQVVAVVSGLVGLGLLWRGVPTLPTWSEQAGFWTLAALTIAASVATISARNPVYSAIWFAISLLGTASLLFLQNAQFLGVATVAVYAGAIVVTFLFVLMLSQPGGHAYYDRMSWGTLPRWTAALVAALFVSLMGWTITRVDREMITERDTQLQAVQQVLAGELRDPVVRSMRLETDTTNRAVRAVVGVNVPPQEVDSLREQRAELEDTVRKSLREQGLSNLGEVRLTWDDLRSPHHMAQLGGRLFGRQWISVQAAGALLMAALVGAVAIASRDSVAGKG